MATGNVVSFKKRRVSRIAFHFYAGLSTSKPRLGLDSALYMLFPSQFCVAGLDVSNSLRRGLLHGNSSSSSSMLISWICSLSCPGRLSCGRAAGCLRGFVPAAWPSAFLATSLLALPLVSPECRPCCGCPISGFPSAGPGPDCSTSGLFCAAVFASLSSRIPSPTSAKYSWKADISSANDVFSRAWMIKTSSIFGSLTPVPSDCTYVSIANDRLRERSHYFGYALVDLAVRVFRQTRHQHFRDTRDRVHNHHTLGLRRAQYGRHDLPLACSSEEIPNRTFVQHTTRIGWQLACLAEHVRTTLLSPLPPVDSMGGLTVQFSLLRPR